MDAAQPPQQAQAGKRSKRGKPYSNAVKRLEAAVEEAVRQVAALEIEKKQLHVKEETLVALVLQQEAQLEHIDAAEGRKKAALQALDMLLDRPPSMVSHKSPFASARLTLDPKSAAAIAAETARVVHNQPPLQTPAQPAAATGSYSPFSQVTAAMLAPLAAAGDQPDAGSSSSTAGGSSHDGAGPARAWQIPDKSTLDTAASNSPQAGGQYVHSCLSNASPEQWEFAMTADKAAWGGYFCDLVLRISLLLKKLEDAPLAAAGTQPAAAGSDIVAQAVRAIVNAGPNYQSVLAPVPAPAAAGMASVGVVAAGDPESWLADLDALVDDFVSVCCLAQLYNPYPIRSACIVDYSTNEVVADIPTDHWNMVRDNIQLSSRQVEQLTVAWQGYVKSMKQLVAKQQRIIDAVNTAAEGEAAEDGAQAFLGPVTALDLAGLEQVQKVLGQHLTAWKNAANLLAIFFINTCTKTQLARFMKASFPYFPRVTPLLAVVCDPASDTSVAADQGRASDQPQLLHEHNMQQLRQHYSRMQQQHRAYWRQRQQLLQPLGLDGLFNKHGDTAASELLLK